MASAAAAATSVTACSVGRNPPKTPTGNPNGVFLHVSQSESRIQDVVGRNGAISRDIRREIPSPDYDSKPDYYKLGNPVQNGIQQDNARQCDKGYDTKPPSESRSGQTIQEGPKPVDYMGRYNGNDSGTPKYNSRSRGSRGSVGLEGQNGSNLGQGDQNSKVRSVSSDNNAKRRSSNSSASKILTADKSKPPKVRPKTGGKNSGGSLPAEKISSTVETTRISLSMDITQLAGVGKAQAAGASRSNTNEALLQKRRKSELKEFQNNITETKKITLNTSENSYYDILQGTEKPGLDDFLSVVEGFTNKEIVRRLKSEQDFLNTVSSPVDLADNEYAWNKDWVINETGRRPGQFMGARDVCFLRSSGNVLITEPQNSRIQVLKTTSGKSHLTLGDNSEYIYDPRRNIEPTCACEIHREDNIIMVTDRDRLLMIDIRKQSRIVSDIPIRHKTDLHGIAITSSRKFILSEVGLHPSVGIYEDFGKLIREFRGTEFRRPSYVSYNDEYEVCAVSDSEKSCVFLYDSNGRLLNTIGRNTTGAKEATLTYPTGLCWLPLGRLLVADRSNNKVTLFDLRNHNVSTVLSKKDHVISNPVALASNSRDRIVVSEEHVQESKYYLKVFKLDKVKQSFVPYQKLT